MPNGDAPVAGGVGRGGVILPVHVTVMAVLTG